MTLPFKIIISFICISTLCGCYNFKGISIPPAIKTFKVENFTLVNPDAPIDLDLLFAETLRQKIREESKLVNELTDPDITFNGEITKYNISYVAPDDNNSASLNRLDIGVKINYVDASNEEKNWSKSYNAFEDFDSNEDFQSLQDDLIARIVEDIAERIFNDSFTNW